MLARVYELKNEFTSFLKNKSINITAFQDAEWLSSLEFLVHLTSQLNKLNLQLQGKYQLIQEMWNHILTFQTKLRLWEFQIKQNNYTQFTTLNTNNHLLVKNIITLT